LSSIQLDLNDYLPCSDMQAAGEAKKRGNLGLPAAWFGDSKAT
jgi:hypothetical protein